MPGSGLGVDSQPYLTFQKLRHMWGEVDKREEARKRDRVGFGEKWQRKKELGRKRKQSRKCLSAGGQQHVTPNSPGDLNIPH